MKRRFVFLLAGTVIVAAMWLRRGQTFDGWEINQSGKLESRGRRGLPSTIEYRATNQTSADRHLTIQVGGDCGEILLVVTDDQDENRFAGSTCDPIELDIPGSGYVNVSLTGRRLRYELSLRMRSAS